MKTIADVTGCIDLAGLGLFSGKLFVFIRPAVMSENELSMDESTSEGSEDVSKMLKFPLRINIFNSACGLLCFQGIYTFSRETVNQIHFLLYSLHT